MSKQIDDYGMRIIHGDRLVERELDELTGLCKGAILDGSISQMEAEGILTWMNNHTHCLDTWPANVLYDQLRAMLADNRFDPREERDLLDLILSFARPESDNAPPASALPVTIPPPVITFTGRNFCFTGVFDYGARGYCEQSILERGGNVLHSVTKKLNYLVIGNVGSEFWKHSTFGTKIAKAVDYRDSGVPIAIVSEPHWTGHLK